MNLPTLRSRLPRFTPLQLVVHGASLAPFIWLMIKYLTDNLTANPIQALTLRTGKFALIWLLLSLACTPLNTVFGFRQAIKIRRALGLYAFFYASLHFLIFIGLDYQFDIDLLEEAIFEKRYAVVGFSALMILLPLAITSTRGWMKRLKQNWKRLHKLVYLAGILVIIHYSWQVKSDIRVPLAYGAVLAILLILRISVVRRFASQFHLSQWSRRIGSTYMTLKANHFRPVSSNGTLDGTEGSQLVIKD